MSLGQPSNTPSQTLTCGDHWLGAEMTIDHLESVVRFSGDSNPSRSETAAKVKVGSSPNSLTYQFSDQQGGALAIRGGDNFWEATLTNSNGSSTNMNCFAKGNEFSCGDHWLEVVAPYPKGKGSYRFEGDSIQNSKTVMATISGSGEKKFRLDFASDDSSELALVYDGVWSGQAKTTQAGIQVTLPCSF
jgi:hypothetical protein